MSFIDLMKSDIWSDADITRRTEAMVRSEFSDAAETILNRKLQGATLGLYALTAEDQIEIGRFQAVVLAADQAGVAARADMALLRQVLEVEAAEARLAIEAVAIVAEPTEEDQAAYDLDQAERAVAQAVIDAAGAGVMEWVGQRRPVEEGGAEL